MTDTHICNFADDTTLNVCDLELQNVLNELEDDFLTPIIWFENNHMKLKSLSNIWIIRESLIKVGNEMIWESQAEKLLGMMVDKDLNFNLHLKALCKRVNQKVSTLAQIARILPFQKRQIILITFIESQFSYCPLVWMFCFRSMKNKFNHIP